MKDFKMRTRDGTFAVVRNQWRRGAINENGKAKPDHVLLDVGVMRSNPFASEGAVEWNCVSLTPQQARRIAAAILKAADEVGR